jgi:purine-binding chemotaxis protein CheW
MTSHSKGLEGNTSEFVTVEIEHQLFGLPIEQVEDVFMPEAITEVPLSNPEVAGVLNLRGRIVTAIDMRRRLGLNARRSDGPPMAVGIEHNGESYGLIIDKVGEVLQLGSNTFEKNPANLDIRWSSISAGVHRLDGHLLVLLDVERVLDLNSDRSNAA